MTKISKILTDRGMSQRDLQRAIKAKFGVHLGDDRISRLYTGKTQNYHLITAKMIADVLCVTIDDITEF